MSRRRHKFKVRYIVDKAGNKKKPYKLLTPFSYYSKRYNKIIRCRMHMRSDGATGARDIKTMGWWVHDQLCDTGLFEDGTKCTNIQASTILYDILRSEGYWFRARTWFISTLALGGGKARRNGIF